MLSPEELARLRPVSARWRRSLLERLDALAAVYRLASAISGVAFPVRFTWYRSLPLDAGLTLLPDGRTVGILRQGLTADRTGFAKRLWRLQGGPMPGTVLVLMTDDVRLRHARRLLATGPVPALLALEGRAALAGAGERIWIPAGGQRIALDLRYVLERAAPGAGASRRGGAATGRPARGLLRRGSGLERPRPPAARPAQGRREARPGPRLRLALDRPGGPGRAPGCLPAPRPASWSTPCRASVWWPDHRERRGTPGPHRPGAGPAGPPRPHLRRRGQEAVEHRRR